MIRRAFTCRYIDMTSTAVSKCIKALPRRETLSSNATKQSAKMWKGVGEKAQWGLKFVSGSAQNFTSASKGVTNLQPAGDSGEGKRSGRSFQYKEDENRGGNVGMTIDKNSGHKTKSSALATQRPKRPSVLDSEIVAKILTVLSMVQSLAAMELKVKFRTYSLSLHKVAGRVKIVHCRLILDAKNLHIRLQIKKSNALLPIPTHLLQAVAAMNVLINRLPLTEQSAFQLFTAIGRAAFTAQEISRPAPVTGGLDVIRDVSSPIMSPADVTSKVWSASEFVNALRRLDLQIWCSPALVLQIKKRKLFARVGRKMVTIDAKEGLEIVKEPRVLFRRREFQEALSLIKVWASSVPELKVALQLVNIAKAIKDLWINRMFIPKKNRPEGRKSASQC